MQKHRTFVRCFLCCIFHQHILVRVVRLERTVSWSQTRRDTNFAIPGYSLFCHDTTASGKNKVFSVCGHSCGQSRFCAAFSNRGKSRERRCRKALRRFASPYPGYNHGTPKAGALPTALHPVIEFSIRLVVFSQECGAVPAPLYPVDSAVGDSPSIPHSGRDFKTFYRVPDHGPGMKVSTKEKAPSSQMVLFGAGDEARTRYLDLGKVALYQMSYARVWRRYSSTMVPPVGVEPTTRGFSVRCSTN